MSLIATLIRKKRLEAGIGLQQLELLREQQRRSAAQWEACQRAVDDARSYLWGQLSSEQELHLQRLQTARAELERSDVRLAGAEQQLREHERALAEREQALRLVQKQIEKLEELLAERARLERAEEQRGEWLLLDEWVTTRTELRHE